jgi:hypothetical protein
MAAGSKDMTDALKGYLTTASAWVASNPTNVVYIAAIVAGFTLLTGGSRRR